jgi:hypothetical protein
MIVTTIIIKPGSGVDPVKGPGPRFYGSTRVNPKKLKKIKNFIFHMKKLKKNQCEYMLHML